MRRTHALVVAVILVVLTPFQANAFCFQAAGERYGVSPWLLWGISRVESNMNPAAVHHNRNGSVDVGLMQINSSWQRQLGGTWAEIKDPCTNVMVGAWLLRQCIQQFGYTWAAVGCYNSQDPARAQRYAAGVYAVLLSRGVLSPHDPR